MDDVFNISGTRILPGENVVVKIPLGRLPVGNQLNMKVHVFRSPNPGPTLLLTGGIHGDEINGIEILRQVLELQLFNQLKCGSVIVVPLVNIYGFISFTRDSTDGKDINRSFPGSTYGSMASKIAGIISRQILPWCTAGIDFHSGSQSRFNFPQIRFTGRHSSAKALAEAFNAPFSLIKPFLQKSLRKTAFDMGIPVLVYEGGETLRVDYFVIQQAIEGIKKVLNHLDMALFRISSQENILLKRMTWLRANTQGLFYPTIQNGSQVSRGQLIGWIHDLSENINTAVVSNTNGYLICVNNRPVVYSGDPLFNIGIT